MYILGVSAFYHDSAACLIKDGEIVAAAQEERFTRKKHDNSFPKNAIAYCLRQAGISPKEVNKISFYEKPYVKFERLLYQFIETYPKSFSTFIETIPIWLNERLNVPQHFEKEGFRAPIQYVSHHLSHAAASYYTSKFDNAAILTMDGVGEWATTTMGFAEGNNITLTHEIHFPHSLGLLYSAITAYLGFSVNNSEYKVMGLAPYGKPKYKSEFDKLVHVYPDGSFSLDMDYFAFTYEKKMNSKKMEELFNHPARKKESEVTQFHKDVAASLQTKTEEIVIKLCNELFHQTKKENICLGGGVALNSVINGKILTQTPFKKICIQPAAGDAGSAMGAALHVWHHYSPQSLRLPFSHAFWGPGFSQEEVKKFLDQKKINYSMLKNTREIASHTAKLIHEGNIVGFFQGRMEWGPRALGARSILANPTDPNIKDILNQKVKHREHFRPFAPVIPVEDAKNWFDCDLPLPEPADYMLMVYPVKKSKREKILGVVHVDGSGRLQTIRKNQHALYYQTIREFEKLSGVPILINTSFNIRGEPIVCTPEDAYRCMMGTGIDYLMIENFLVARKDNLQDAWDSEKLAND
ncbi:MAG: carbamoyltransferase [Candidatus Diapherotrites archaeon]